MSSLAPRSPLKVAASDFLNSSKRNSNPVKVKNNECLFCNKFHLSQDYRYAMNLPYEKRKEILMEKVVCFRCLTFKLRHIAQYYKNEVNYSKCKEPHLLVMYKMNEDHGNRNNEIGSGEKIVAESLINTTRVLQVYLQILIVRNHGNDNKSNFIRCLIGIGSQQSYISTFAATVMEYSVLSEVSVLHSNQNSLKWDNKNNTLSVDVIDFDPISENLPVSRGTILSTVHKIFDPIGFNCPVTLIPKLMLQECWKLKLSWESGLPSEMVRKFVNWKNQLRILNDISVPRRLNRCKGDRKKTVISVTNIEHEEKIFYLFSDYYKRLMLVS
ncbi:uncharacterized protein NPIL_614081 [Nephila pilipes]|uniref:Uncharacterized protein n=1 Tax=Nephila pilipes TaxID=299642 RepID=A0A8X6PG03_NEPPI|nr:uncharacterized protein NPIL_614081 [Nephila pilipes]